ncbi:CAF17-like 4Fe-4S cluster assembly/insertion protein YgfZ [Aureliella helgolandensis]|uniref:CAF17-like 4Fe-4S cluster assembly/insertion protein YgfZ n=1 Tax=Aureliella helgolandensis TaxID=2527968 RepID=UPI0018D1A8B7|nr:hypothetical protein [Aureliella helgolandensis]
MNQPYFTQLSIPLMVEVVGQDAAKIVNNLCTQDIAKLGDAESRESFVTNLRGWAVAHGAIAILGNSVWIFGQHSRPEAVAQHIDRYIIREDAEVREHSNDRALYLIGQPYSTILGESTPTELPLPGNVNRFELPTGEAILEIPIRMWGATSVAWIVEQAATCAVDDFLVQHSLQRLSNEECRALQIQNFWPLESCELLEKTIPQEIDRDGLAISFTKGCYLGQETIARLDARGQLQKKLALIELPASAKAGDVILHGDKEVGVLSSVAGTSTNIPQPLGLATLKRGSFNPGTELTCNGDRALVLAHELT